MLHKIGSFGESFVGEWDVGNWRCLRESDFQGNRNKLIANAVEDGHWAFDHARSATTKEPKNGSSLTLLELAVSDKLPPEKCKLALCKQY